MFRKTTLSIAMLIVFTVIAPPIYAQQTEDQKKDKPAEKPPKPPKPTILFSVGKGSGLTYSGFYEEPQKRIIFSLWHTGVNLIGINYDIAFKADLNKTVSDIEFSAHGHGFKIGPVITGVGFTAKQFKLEEKIFDSKSLTVTGKTQKQLALFTLETGVGRYDKSHFRVGGFAGGIRIRSDVFFSINETVVNETDTKYNEDALPIYGSGFRVILVPIKIIRIGVRGYNLLSDGNKQGLIEKKYSNLEGEIYIFPIKRVGISARASASKNSSETFSVDNHLSINIVLKLKTP